MTRLLLNLRFLYYDVERFYYRYVVHPLNVAGVILFVAVWLLSDSLVRDPQVRDFILRLVPYVFALVVIGVIAWAAEPEKKVRRTLLMLFVNLLTNVLAGEVTKTMALK